MSSTPLRGQTVLLLAALTALLLAVLGVQSRRIEYRINAMAVFDITQSMNVEDVRLAGKPASRLALAREAVRHSLARLPCGSRLGYGVFTEYRTLILFLPIEVCANRQPLDDALNLISPRMAWSGNSEIAKGYLSGLRLLKRQFGVATDSAEPGSMNSELLGRIESGAKPGGPAPALVFMTDGHEAPPVNPKLRPRYDGKPGESPAVLVGVGGEAPQPIPKFDPYGRALGVWNADEVAQRDVYSEGRGSDQSDKLVDADAPAPTTPAEQAAFARQSGAEHLSSLRADYLRLLAAESGAQYLRLTDVDRLLPQLTEAGLSQPIEVLASWDRAAAITGLTALLLFYAAPVCSRIFPRSARAGYRS